MLNALLQELDSYNLQLKKEEMNLREKLLAKLKEFCMENLAELQEADRLNEAIKNEPILVEDAAWGLEQSVNAATLEQLRNHSPMEMPLGALSPEREAYVEKGALLVRRLNERIGELRLVYISQSCTASMLEGLLNEGKELAIVPEFFVMPDSPICKLEDKGYAILFQAIGDILRGLKPDPNLQATYWGGGSDYVSIFIKHGQWKHLGIEKGENPYGIPHIVHDANSSVAPFPDGSEDIALIKTLGSSVGNATRQNIWKKATAALKVGGILISSYEQVPEELRDSYQQVANLGNTGRDFLQFAALTERLTHFFPEKIYFFQKVA